MMLFIIFAIILASTAEAKLPALPKPIIPSISFKSGEVKSLDVTLTPNQSSFKIKGYWKGTDGTFVIELRGEDVNTRMSFRPEEDGSFVIDIDVKEDTQVIEKTKEDSKETVTDIQKQYSVSSLLREFRDHVCLKSVHDKYVVAEPSLGWVYMSSQKESWRIEEMSMSSDTHLMTLWTSHGAELMLASNDDGSAYLMPRYEYARNPAPGVWELFKNSDGTYSFPSSHGQWLSADGNFLSTPKMTKTFGSSERFSIERCQAQWKSYRQTGEICYICGNFRYFTEKERIVSHFRECL